MKAVAFKEHGGPDKLSYEDMPMPQIGQQEVLIRVKACAVNHLDIWIRLGNPAYPMPLPHVGGSDVSGIGEKVGSQVEGVSVGARVLVSPGISCWRCQYCLEGRDNMCRTYNLLGAVTHGGNAEYVKVPFRNVLSMSENLSFEQTAAFPLVSVTAAHMLFPLAALQHGETVLVMGAGSGVGMMAVQMAKLAGARVLTTVGSDDSAMDIWFDSIPSGSLGSLHCFDGDENGEKPSARHIAKFNGLNALVRKEAVFTVKPMHAKWQGGLRAWLSPSWERIENGRTVLLALRTHHFDGRPIPTGFKDGIQSNLMLVIAALDDEAIGTSRHIGIVPFGDGRCTIKNAYHHAKYIEHYPDGKSSESHLTFSDQLTLNLVQHETLEWIEIIFERE